MNPKSVIITTGQNNPVNKKFCGVYPLERNIRLFWQAGVNNFHLNLSDKEKELYIKKIEKKVSKLKDISIKLTDEKPSDKHYQIQSNHFIQFHHFNNIEKYFSIKNNQYIPLTKDDLFLLKTKSDRKNAELITTKHIRANTGGWIARNINKLISIPLSRLLTRTGVHPNVLTFVNMLFAFASVGFVLIDNYWYTLLGAFLFQWVSIFDGCDGEVAKMTCKFSKFGSWFDTFNDYLAIFMFLVAAAYRYLLAFNFSLNSIILVIVPMFGGLAIMLIGIIYYLKKYSHSGSFVAYDKEFLQKLPKNEFLIRVIMSIKYITRKEFYSLAIFFIAIFDYFIYIAPIDAVVQLIGGILILSINIKYFKLLPFDKENPDMMYVSKR